jgi:lauroyl/myristoyl acyltransferase
MRAIPRRFRFPAAVMAARALAPLIRHTDSYREQRQLRMDGIMEIALQRALESMTRHGTPFDPVVRYSGTEKLLAAVRKGRGVMIATPHAMLTYLILRHFQELGHSATAIAGDPRFLVSGTSIPARAIRPSPSYLLEVRSRLRRGEIVAAMLDRDQPHPGLTVEFETAYGPVIISTALLRIAVRCNAQVVFAGVRTESGEVVGHYDTPGASSTSVEDITADFIRFVQTHVAAVVAEEAGRGIEN